ncbi:MAG: lyase family protein, partial [Candidatus Micrarchaeota archaeon]|nr:lyase family protein [Candidatus Micrarchaeota archaeon]
ASGQVTGDLNRMSSDLILFSMPEFGYFELPPEFCTGSSIMPHKKNPDVLELVRAKHHQLVACEFEVKSIASNLISGYHRDLQLTKEPIMRGIEIAKDSVGIMALVIGKLGVNKKKCEQAMTGELYSAQKAIELAKKEKIPFRDAYKKVADEF